MTHDQFLKLLDQLLEFDPGTLKGDETLAAISQWDSLAIIGFIALIDQHFGMSVPAIRITTCATVADLCRLTGVKPSQ